MSNYISVKFQNQVDFKKKKKNKNRASSVQILSPILNIMIWSTYLPTEF